MCYLKTSQPSQPRSEHRRSTASALSLPAKRTAAVLLPHSAHQPLSKKQLLHQKPAWHSRPYSRPHIEKQHELGQPCRWTHPLLGAVRICDHASDARNARRHFAHHEEIFKRGLHGPLDIS
eukprot:361313-Chlamydomonas_euryale.AAC.11